jgi:hypothetical protein
VTSSPSAFGWRWAIPRCSSRTCRGIPNRRVSDVDWCSPAFAPGLASSGRRGFGVAAQSRMRIVSVAGILVVGLIVGITLTHGSENHSKDHGALTIGAASPGSSAAALQSCTTEEVRLQHQYGNGVQLVASYPTDLQDAWNFANPSTLPSGRAPSRWRLVSAKLCLYDGPFRYGPPIGGGPYPPGFKFHLPVLPKMAEVLAPNGLGDGSELRAWPHGVLPLRNLHPYSGRIVHWPPW